MANGNRPNGSKGSITLLTVLIVLAVLYFARSVFIPLSLAVLLAFLLGPLVIRLRHLGLGRVLSALSVVLLSFLLVGVMGTLMGSQMADLAHKLPEYQQNVHHKIQSLRTSGGGLVNRFTKVVHEITDALTPPLPPVSTQPGTEKPVPVEIRRSPFSPFDLAQKVLGSVLGTALTAAIVIVFVLFMLIEREDLRDRLIRLGGAGRVNLTTKVLDDAAHRVSRYLLAQMVINMAFGVLAGCGLYLLRIPNPFLWAILAALLRYIPYLGIWIAATMPALLALAVDPGWMMVPAIFVLYFGIDLLAYNFAEPFLYGTSTGISPLGILVAAVFWTWLWGPVGLLLATPLTVCVVVIGQHVPNLEFLSVLLSDQEVLPPETRFYQRMLAMDLEEATEVAEEFLKEGHPLEQLYDQVIVPALQLAENDRHRGKLDEVRQQFIFQNTRLLVEDMADRADELAPKTDPKDLPKIHKEDKPPKKVAKSEAGEVLCIPARDEADEIAALMLNQLLAKRGIGARVLSSTVLAGETVNLMQQQQPAVAVVTAVPPFGHLHARYLCRRIRKQFGRVKLVCATLSQQDASEIPGGQPPLPADEMATSLQQTLAQTIALIPVQDQSGGKQALAS